MTYSLYSIPVTIDVIAEDREQAENLICDILDRAFIYGVGYKEAEIQRTQTAADVARVFDFEIREVKEMIWEDVMGEQLTYDGSEECLSMLRDRDLFISNDGHLCEMCSLTACRDYGAISIGDKILITGDFREIYVSRKGVKND